MSFSLATGSDNVGGLQSLLAEITEIDRQVGELSNQIDTLKDKRAHLEKLAIEDMTTQRLDRVGVAGRSWRVEYDHHCSVSEARKEAVMEAARKAGLEDVLTSVNTAKLKSLLKEMAKAAGKEASESFSEGTVFEGLVGEHVAPRLRHATTG